MMAIPAYELFSFYELFQKRFLQLLRIMLSHLLVDSDNSNFSVLFLAAAERDVADALRNDANFPVLFLAARRNNVTFVGRIFIR